MFCNRAPQVKLTPGCSCRGQGSVRGRDNPPHQGVRGVDVSMFAARSLFNRENRPQHTPRDRRRLRPDRDNLTAEAVFLRSPDRRHDHSCRRAPTLSGDAFLGEPMPGIAQRGAVGSRPSAGAAGGSARLDAAVPRCHPARSADGARRNSITLSPRPGVHQNSVPSTQMQCRMTASLRASATTARLHPIRLLSRTAHALRGDQPLTLFSSTTAASNRHRLTMLSPAFETRPGRSISPDW
jgi:hypothetical protein